MPRDNVVFRFFENFQTGTLPETNAKHRMDNSLSFCLLMIRNFSKVVSLYRDKFISKF